MTMLSTSLLDRFPTVLIIFVGKKKSLRLENLNDFLIFQMFLEYSGELVKW